jgi:hypothetical protein
MVLVSACSTHSPLDPQISAVLDDTFTLRVGQEVTFTGEPLRILFEEVPEDSRCPLQVLCVWAGNAIVRLRVGTATANAQRIELNTTLEPHVISVLGYEISLERLDPYPQSDNRIPQRQYAAHFRVTKH